GARPEWIFGEMTGRALLGHLDGSPVVPFALILLLGATWLAWRRAKDAFRLDCIVLVAIASGVFAVTRIVGGLFPYLIRWTWPLGMMVVLAALWSWMATWRRVPSALFVVALIGIAALAGVNAVNAAKAGNPNRPVSEVIGPLTERVRGALPSGNGVVVLRSK